jgi:hypothetical protein
MNIGAYIHRRYIPQFLHRLIKEYNVYSSNIGAYIHQRYIPRLIEEYNVYSSIIKVCSSVITDECSNVSYSVSSITI